MVVQLTLDFGQLLKTFNGKAYSSKTFDRIEFVLKRGENLISRYKRDSFHDFHVLFSIFIQDHTNLVCR